MPKKNEQSSASSDIRPILLQITIMNNRQNIKKKERAEGTGMHTKQAETGGKAIPRR